MKRKSLAVLLAASMIMSMTACSSKPAETTAAATEAAKETEATTEAAKETSAATEAAGAPVELSLWTYPIGDWGDQATVDGLVAKFNEAHPEITLKVEYLTYQDGDDKVNTDRSVL